ncbi:MAG: hypothetical protein AAGC82_09175 [Pseudomonadota bacterium]
MGRLNAPWFDTRCVLGEYVLDIDGGIGFVGLLCAKIAGQRRVVSYAADQSLEPIIRANYAQNAITPALRMKAVMADDGPITFPVAENVLASLMQARDFVTRDATVDSDPFQTVLRKLRPDVVVMDRDGAETALLPCPALASVHSVVVEVYPHIVEGTATLLGHNLPDPGFECRQEMRRDVWMERK